MNMKEIIKSTGMTKKSVYFYIEEGIITPEKSPDNGYYIFSEMDKKLLTAVRVLRQLGVSVQEIHQILEHPSLTPSYLYHRLDEQKKQLKNLLESTQRLNGIVSRIVPRVELDYLLDFLPQAGQLEIEDEWSRLSLSRLDREARLTSMLVWRFFLEVPPTEYRIYLWGKIIEDTDRQIRGNLVYLRWYLRLLDPVVIEEDSAKTYERTNAVALASSHELEPYVQEMVEACRQLAEKPLLQEYWKLEYERIILPLLTFTSGPTQHLIGEYNPKYSTYAENMHRCCQAAREILLHGEENALYLRLMEKLEGKFDLQMFDGALLGFLHVFEGSLYTRLDLKGLRLLVESEIPLE